jgi:hypothetical protein
VIGAKDKGHGVDEEEALAVLLRTSHGHRLRSSGRYLVRRFGQCRRVSFRSQEISLARKLAAISIQGKA